MFWGFGSLWLSSGLFRRSSDLCPQLRMSRHVSAAAGRMEQVPGCNLLVEGQKWEVEARRIPLQSTRAEDGLVLPSRHTYSHSTEHHMGSTHTSVHGDRRPLKHHLRYCGGCGPARSVHCHSTSRLPSWYPICIPGTGLHQSSKKKHRTCSVRHRLTAMARSDGQAWHHHGDNHGIITILVVMTMR